MIKFLKKIFKINYISEVILRIRRYNKIQMKLQWLVFFIFRKSFSFFFLMNHTVKGLNMWKIHSSGEVNTF